MPKGFAHSLISGQRLLNIRTNGARAGEMGEMGASCKYVAYELKVNPRRYEPGNGRNAISGPGIAIRRYFLSAESELEW